MADLIDVTHYPGDTVIGDLGVRFIVGFDKHVNRNWLSMVISDALEEVAASRPNNDKTKPTKTFRLVADFEFQAEDLDDAFNKVHEHFRKLKEAEESDLVTKGQCILSESAMIEAMK